MRRVETIKEYYNKNSVLYLVASKVIETISQHEFSELTYNNSYFAK